MKLRTNASALKGRLEIPGDKSISHRALIFGAIANGLTEIEGLLKSDDVLATMAAFQAMGVAIIEEEHSIKVYGKGIKALKKPCHDLDMGNSGTSTRLIAGVLAGCPFKSQMIGDASLSRRPMDRISVPLNQMGAKITGHGDKVQPPLGIEGSSHLQGITYQMPVASAQVKSAILLAGLQAQGQTVIYEKAISRNHTEDMIRAFGGQITIDGKHISLSGPQELVGQNIQVPGDISSAAFFIVAGLIIKGSDLLLKNVGINETRTGILDVVKQMGANIEILNENKATKSADLRVQYSSLKAVKISGDIIPRLIDELPIIALLASQAEGQTRICDAQELKHKETDRIKVVVETLSSFGVPIIATDDGMIINGPCHLHAHSAHAHLDHRIAMMVAIAALLVKEGDVELEGHEAISSSYPKFFTDLERLLHD
ncbi:3-phosphoshikimate 1-carboxyvinyltransferase [Streptococcus iniae]|uniref:3-phosphoshikimate 1-carboxyvinyltransferase n=1 Tax=Streptococcus iniae TaxID=1346 RepID=UPI0008DA778D|nr:3-phosphoshikimate 1-carboxyvinyltransferase [Streptococcus iniae]OHX27414.1 3-phosphoshikimate 1-carboxyvinyltransferase [Streptococcus iniae]RLV28146.1 3-phosphoshikimate 1-carboxyvinyltransferase [Streptococcus iniae]